MQNNFKILNFVDHSKTSDLAEDFLENIKFQLLESKKDDNLKEIEKYTNKIKSDLKIHFAFSATFGTGLALMVPIVKDLIENQNINVETNFENLVLLTITSLTILYLETKKESLEIEQIQSIERDSKTLLTELKLKGIGGGIVKKLINVYNSISQLFNHIFRSLGIVTQSLLDIFAYTTILVPFINSVKYIVGKYDLNFENFITNFASIGIGALSLVSKHGIDYIKSKLKKNLGKDFDDLDTPKSPEKEVEIIQDKFF